VWPIGPSLVLWKEGDLVKVCSAPWQKGMPGIILRVLNRRHAQWYDVLVGGKIESLMHLDFEPYNECKSLAHGVQYNYKG